MEKTLVLAVDRDDDFGVKAGVPTPVIGLEAVKRAASMLGVVDPEDSDINTVYAAIKVYNELKAEGKEAEVALICGDTKVGHKSDLRIADELDMVIDEVEPDKAILVSDGAEDEYVYPMITARLKVDSVKKVYVKQAPGIESAFYVLLKILKDNDKRKRLLAPLGFILMVISFVLMMPPLLSYRETGELIYVYNAIASFVVFSIGLMIFLFAYRAGERAINYVNNVMTKVRSGDSTVIFTIVAFALFCVGIMLGITAATAPRGIDDGQRVLIFVSNSLWVIAFAYICNDFGGFLKRYVEEKKVLLGFMVGTLMIFSAAFIIQATLDALSGVFNYDIIGQEMILIELGIGFAFAAVAGMTQLSYKRFLNKRNRAEQSDAVQ